MNNSTDPIISYYQQLFAQLNLSHLMIQYNDSVNSTLLKEILEENFIWPPDMRWFLQQIAKISELENFLRFTAANVICITVYSLQLLVGLAVNSYSLVYLLRERMALHNKNRMILLLIHLTCADLFVSECF